MKLRVYFLLFSIVQLLVVLLQDNVIAQARIVFGTGSDAYIVMNNTAINQAPTSIYLVIGDGITGTGLDGNTISRTTKGAIISNSENNIVKWGIGNSNGVPQNYVVPWAYGTIASYAGNYIPFTYSITAVGQADHFVKFSTYRTASSNNQATPPTGVTTDWSSACACNASPWMVDRYWMLDNDDYGSVANTPNGALIFTYVDEAGVGNAENETGSLTAAMEIDLQAESYNSFANNWTGVLFAQDVPASDYVVTGNIGSANLYQRKYWTLVEKNHPLPVSWLELTSECINKNVIISWSTAAEQNADHFTIERSVDGDVFTAIGTVQAAGNSSSVQNYSFTDNDAFGGTSYYRIRETDYNGESFFSKQITQNGCSPDMSISVFPNPALGSGSFNVAIAGNTDDEVLIVVTDMLGQEFYSRITVLSNDEEVVAIDPEKKLAAGVYTVIASSNNEIYKKKIVIQ